MLFQIKSTIFLLKHAEHVFIHVFLQCRIIIKTIFLASMERIQDMDVYVELFISSFPLTWIHVIWPGTTLHRKFRFDKLPVNWPLTVIPLTLPYTWLYPLSKTEEQLTRRSSYFTELYKQIKRGSFIFTAPLCGLPGFTLRGWMPSFKM